MRSLSYDLGSLSRLPREAQELSTIRLGRILVDIFHHIFGEFRRFFYIFVIEQGRKLVRSLSYDLRSTSRGSREALEACFACL